MTLTDLNENVNYKANFKDGVVVYLDKDEKKIRLQSSGEELRGLTHTIRNEADLIKVLKIYNNTDPYMLSLIVAFLNVDYNEFIRAQNDAKSKNSDIEFRKALAAMSMDIQKTQKYN